MVAEPSGRIESIHRALFTPADVHYGRAGELLEVRADVLAGAYATHPERFVKRPRLPRLFPTEVWINPPPKEVPQAGSSDAGVSLGLTGSAVGRFARGCRTVADRTRDVRIWEVGKDA